MTEMGGMEPLIDCHCMWCGNDFQTTDRITNTCSDCRSKAHYASQAVLREIRREREMRDLLADWTPDDDGGAQ